MTMRLIWFEWRRLVVRPRFVAALLVMLGLSILKVYDERSFTAGTAHFQGALSMAAADWLPLTTPLVVGIVAAGSLAEDRRRNYTTLVLARGFSRRRYILAKASAMALASALVMLLGCVIFLCIAAATLPAGRTPFEDGVGLDALGNQITIPAAAFYPGPIPRLYAYSPLLSDGVSVVLEAV